MKINVQGSTDAERFKNAIGKILSVSSEDMKRRIAADPRGKPNARKRKTKASASGRASKRS